MSTNTNNHDIPLALSGDKLIEAMKKIKEKRAPIAEGFLYEQTINMISADPGIGKSTISTQMAVELAAGLPVFGVFKPPRPMKVFVNQAERAIIELLERLESISKVLPIVKENLFVTDEYQKLDLLNPSHADKFIDCVERDCPGADMIVMDPIYCMVSGGLKEDKPASAFTKTMSLLQKRTKAALWYNHHNTKPQYTNKGDKVQKDDPFYGSQWIKAHVTGSFSMEKTENGVTLFRKKDNYRLLPNNIILEYDPETELCSIPYDELPAIERLRNFLRARQKDGKNFYFKDVEAVIKVSPRRLRDLLLHSSIKEAVFVISSIKNKNLYGVKQMQI